MYQSNLAAAKKRTNSKSRKKDFILPDEDQQYAVVKALLGNGRLNALCQDGIERLGKIRGSMRHGPNKTIVNKNDLIIVSARDFENKVDVLHKYTHEEASYMFRIYHIPDALKKAYNSSIGDLDADDTNNQFEFIETDEGTQNVHRNRSKLDELDDLDALDIETI